MVLQQNPKTIENLSLILAAAAINYFEECLGELIDQPKGAMTLPF